MVVALGPGKFYGSSLPRPRFYTDLKFSDERVDSPLSVTDPLMSWAEEAHWSMGGLNPKRHRLQGRIEGSIKKLRAEREKFHQNHAVLSNNNNNKNNNKQRSKDSVSVKSKRKKSEGVSWAPSRNPSPPPAPIAIKRRRYVALVDESDEEEEVEETEIVRKWSRRKLTEDFDRVAAETGMGKRRASGCGGRPVKSSGNGSQGVGFRTRSSRRSVTYASPIKKSRRLVKVAG